MRTKFERLASHWAAPPLVFLAGALLLRLPSFFMSVVDWDESLYLLIADDVRAGYLPYDRTWDHKQPGIFYLFALAGTLFGGGVGAIRVLGLLCAAGGAWLCHRLASRSWNLPGIGWAAGAFYLAQTSINGGLATNTEIVFSLFVLLAFAFAQTALGREGKRRRVWLWAAGLAAGMAFAIKLVVALDLVALALVHGSGLRARAERGSRAWLMVLVRDGLQIALAFVAINVAVLLPHVLSGKGALLYEAVVEYNMTYGSVETSSSRIAMGLFALLALSMGAVLTLTSIGLSDLLEERVERQQLWATWAWLLLALLSPIGQRKMFPHHFLQIAGPSSILFGLGVSLLAAPLFARRLRMGVWALAALTCIGVAHPFARLQYEHQRLLRAVAHGDARQFDLPMQVARAILAASGPGASVYAYNDQPIIYELVGTHAPTRFPFPLHLLRVGREVPGLDRPREFARILATAPEWIVVRDEATPPRFFAELKAELDRHYAEHAHFAVTERNEQHFFGFIYRSEPTGDFVRLYRRRP